MIQLDRRIGVLFVLNPFEGYREVRISSYNGNAERRIKPLPAWGPLICMAYENK